MASNPLADFGAGLSSFTSGIEPHPAGPAQHGTKDQMQRAFSAASTFFSGVMAISASQFLGAPLKMMDPKFYDAYMAFTKQSFGVLITTMTQWWSPTVVRVSGDMSLPKQLFRRQDGSLECRFPKRIVMMANHQLYTDWLYLWWVSYTNNMHGYIYIILKESLKKIPIVGWGAQFYNFIFLSRNWEQDKPRFEEHLSQLSNPNDPMWLLIFPEGTNLAKGTRETSRKWAQKNGLQDMKHQLLPRSRGLQFCLQRLRQTTEWLYDCTIAYEGIPPGKFGQDVFTLRSSLFEGRPPKSVNMHFRRFRISKIPIDNDKDFDQWLRNRWREKDYLLEHFVRFNHFPDDQMWMAKQKQAGKKDLVSQNAKFIETEIKSNSLEEFLSIFAPLTSVMMVLFLFYGGSNPEELMRMIGEARQQGGGKVELMRDKDSSSQPLKLRKATKGAPSDISKIDGIDNMTPAAAQKELILKYLESVRPAASGQISLPEDSLRIANARSAGSSTASLKSSRPGSVANTPRIGSKSPSLGGESISNPMKLPEKPKAAVKALPSTGRNPLVRRLSTSSAPPKIGGLSRPSMPPPRSITSTASVKSAPVTTSPTLIPFASTTIRPQASVRSPTKNVPKTPIYKVDKATYDRLVVNGLTKPTGQTSKPVEEDKNKTFKRVTVDPGVPSKLKSQNKKS